MMRVIFTFLFFISLPLAAQESQGKKVIVQYKKYETIDLGNLEIKGQIIAPGDLSVSDRSYKKFNRNLFERYNFNPEIEKDLENLR